MYLVAIILLYRVFIVSITLSNWRWRRRTASPLSPSKAVLHGYVFLFPVFREQKIIRDTLQYYESFLAYSENIQLLFITTIKERGDSNNTAEYIEAYRQGSGFRERIHVVESHQMTGTKATQLNVGLHWVRTKYQQQQFPYVVCFDCDARIAIDDFIQVDRNFLNKGNACIYSFVPVSKIAAYSKSVAALMLHHLERVFVWEYIPSLIASASWNYPMGATMVIAPQLWDKLPAFPEPIDDIPLQYLLRWKGVAYRSLPFFTQVQSPPNLGNAFRQIIPILHGVFCYFSLAQRYHVSLTLKQSVAGICWYIVFILEFIAIAISPYLLWRSWPMFIILFIIPAIIHLVWRQCFSFLNLALYLLGFYLRLLQFCYFLVKIIFSPPQLHQFKTDRT